MEIPKMSELIENTPGVPIVAQWKQILTRNHEVAGSIPNLTQWVKDLASLWLWRRSAAVALIRPLAWEPPHAADAALKRKINKQINKQTNKKFKCQS